MNNQNGFILLAVMIMTTMTSVIVLSSLRDNIIQERLTGNYQKKMNARLVSEKGIFETHKRVTDELAANPNRTLEQLINDTLGENDHLTGRADTTDMRYITNIGVNSDGLLEISSEGMRFEGFNNTVALFRVIKGGTTSTFGSAIVGCNGVNLIGSGSIDSYDSSKGNYNRNNATKDSEVTTIKRDSDISLSGGTHIKGSLSVTGSITLTGSAKIYGDAHANGNIVINSGGGTTVGGDVLARGNVELIQTKVGGVIRTMGNLKLGHSGEVLNQTNNGLDVMYRGSLSFPDWRKNIYQQDGFVYDDKRFNKNPNVPEVPNVEPNNLDTDHDAQDPAINCDPIGISSVINDFKDLSSPNLSLTRGGPVYELTPSRGQIVSGWKNWMGNKPPVLLSTIESLPNDQLADMFKVRNFLVNGGTFKVSGGDVYLMVDGNFEIGSSGTTKFQIESGSSLTIYVTGKTKIRQPVITEQGLSESGVPVFSIYSSYEGKDGLVIDATGSIYAAIYAPKTDAKITASGGLMGAVRAKTVTVSGAGGIHYDTKLGDISNLTTCCGSTKIEFVGWRYY